MVTLDDADVVTFAGELESSCKTAKASSNNKNVNVCARVCPDGCELHCFVFGDRA
jgi:hypothetical protein